MMRTPLLAVALVTALAACNKKAVEEAPAAEPAATTAPATQADNAGAGTSTQPATAAEPTDAERERAEKQGKLDYATMEDGYLGDAKGQWAGTATASSSYGSGNDADADSQDSNTPWQATGAPNGSDWTNNSQNVGFDWIQLEYAAAVTPTEVRAVLSGNQAPEAITKIELIDTAGKAHLVWSGLSDSKSDERGRRTWFVRKVDAADYTTDTVKVTFANNVASGYKTVDAVQLVGK